MIENVQLLLPYLVLGSHLVLVLVLASYFSRRSWGKQINNFVGKHSILVALIISVSVVLGSLFYSEIVGFEPCVLCWWQRVFLYPLTVLFIVAWQKKLENVFVFAVPLVMFAAIIALYHSFANWGGGSILSCTAVGGACAKVYVKEFGYITIPSMSLTAAIYILLLAWINRKYKNENSHS